MDRRISLVLFVVGQLQQLLSAIFNQLVQGVFHRREVRELGLQLLLLGCGSEVVQVGSSAGGGNRHAVSSCQEGSEAVCGG